MPLTIIGGITWAVYSSMMGRLVGGFFHEQPLLGAVVSICVAVLLGIGVDHVMQRLQSDKADASDDVSIRDATETGDVGDSGEPGPTRAL